MKKHVVAVVSIGLMDEYDFDVQVYGPYKNKEQAETIALELEAEHETQEETGEHIVEYKIVPLENLADTDHVPENLSVPAEDTEIVAYQTRAGYGAAFIIQDGGARKRFFGVSAQHAENKAQAYLAKRKKKA